ncbi:MAG: roadblock/LC7 domain-containing protein [Desulfuromonadales bacterium]
MAVTQVNDLLNHTLTTSSCFDGLAVVDRDGIILAFAMAGEVRAEQVVSVGVSIFEASKAASEELQHGDFRNALIECEHGFIMFSILDDSFALVALSDKASLLGTVLTEVKHLTEDIRTLL